MKKIILFPLCFLAACADYGEQAKYLINQDKWPAAIEGEIVIINVIADDTGIISADGWVELHNSEERIGLVFEGEVLKLIDLSYDPVGVHKIWVNLPSKMNFPVVKVSKIK